MILVEKSGVRYLFANYTLANVIKDNYKFLKFIDIPKIRVHHLAAGCKIDDYIEKQNKYISTHIIKIKEHTKIRDALINIKAQI